MPQPADHLLRLLFDQGKDHAVALLDPAGVIAGWLPGAEYVTGYSAEEAVGRPISIIFTPEDIERGSHEHELTVARADGRSEDDRWMARKDGTRIWASGVLYPLREPGGELVGFGKVFRDRTDTRAQVEALANGAERHKVFLGILGHEMRNTLAPLANVAQVVRMIGTDERLDKPMLVFERQLGSLRRLVNDLMDVTRVGAGKVDLKPMALLLNDVLNHAADACRPQAEARGQDFRVLLLPADTALRADPERLQQVFVNLLTNAIKYTPRGGGVWLKSSVEGGEAVVRVEDTGVGIEADMLPKIFELFTQEASSLGQSDGGLGLGLPLVRELVSLHGGTVQVRSEGRGKGSEFVVRLPLPRPVGPCENA